VQLLVLDRALRLEPALAVRVPLRELTPDSWQILVEQAGLHVRRFPHRVRLGRSPEQMPALVRFLRDNGLDRELRGDDYVPLAERTDTLPSHAASSILPI